METLPIITIDGPAGVGKSTLARAVAREMSWPYLDTGAMFRTLALRLGEGAESTDPEELQARCKQYRFALEGHRDAAVLTCNGEPVGDEIRTEAVGRLASLIGTNPVVREYLKVSQRQIGESNSLVAEGRDMGTVVFPMARFKFFLTASPEVRALRRARELEARGLEADVSAIAAQIRTRDELDSQRVIAPLRPAEDAMCIDTSALAVKDVLAAMLYAVCNASGGNCR